MYPYLKRLEIRPLQEDDKPWIRAKISENWGSTSIVTCGKIYDTTTLPGYVAFDEKKPVGLLCYKMHDDAMEIVVLDCTIAGRGCGTELMYHAEKTAKNNGYRKMKVTTTNDNTNALRFYQKLEYTISAIRIGAITEYRKTLKPEIAIKGFHGIPIRDEIELEKIL
ncbi:MAG: GNAT family N-acetyltransferase [Candidatus Lokiarchaeota archaeon]|nr:GNAT family N-acetyltransferase [Candidatus Lokiarchaeota archaeon]